MKGRAIIDGPECIGVANEFDAMLRALPIVDDAALSAHGWECAETRPYSDVFIQGDHTLKIFRPENAGYHAWIENAPNSGGPYPRRLSPLRSVVYRDGGEKRA